MELAGLGSYQPATVADAERWASVLAPVVDRGGEPSLLFIKRAEHLGSHPGQMAFPGGGHEPFDPDLVDTARREAWEEIGLHESEPSIVGRLDDTTTTSGYAIRPFVAEVPDRVYEPDENEVAEIATLPVTDLTDPTNYESERRTFTDREEHRIHYFHVGDYTVWGATGRMLVQLLELTTDWRAPETPDRVVDAEAEFPV
jgi:8-oxo-dGTP pyrophosphatase MutT (NUDIX family)